jgi:glyoxylase I family protein
MQVHHIAFRTDDVEGLVAFYRDMFGLAECRDARPRAVWLALGPAAVLMVERREPAEPALPAASMELVALRAGDARERDAIRRRAEEAGCFDGATEHTVYLRDPDGRRVGVSTFALA